MHQFSADQLLAIAVQNSLVALALAGIVYCVTRVWRIPPLAHLLWVLVLLKLVAPPVAKINWPTFARIAPAEHAASGARESLYGNGPNIDVVPSGVAARSQPLPKKESDSVRSAIEQPRQPAPRAELWPRVKAGLIACWLVSAIVFALRTAVRIRRAGRLLRSTIPAPGRLTQLADEVAARLGLRRVPTLRCADGVEIPFVWCAGRRPLIVLPQRMLLPTNANPACPCPPEHDTRRDAASAACPLSHLDDRQTRLILAHELAHLRRRDHWVRWIEIVIASVCWWNPLVWLVRRQIHGAEDLCCDAWVRWAYPDCRAEYAELLFQVAESVNRPRPAAALLPASPFLCTQPLKERIEMVVESKSAPRVSKKSLCVAALVALAILISFGRSQSRALLAAQNEKPATTGTPDTSFFAQRFKYRVPFEIGDSEMKDGGRIEIKEVWGTRPKIEVGGQYLVRGKYVLPPGVRGKLYFYLTATGRNSGSTSDLDLQTTLLDEPEGEFALVHGMAGEGYFHLRLTVANHYSRYFANVYFGTDGNVYRPKHEAKTARNTRSERQPTREEMQQILGLGTRWEYDIDASKVRDADAARMMLSLLLNNKNLKLPHAVHFQLGQTQFKGGDAITVSEIRGTSDTFSPGNVYDITGSYKLSSHAAATLSANTTAKESANSISSGLQVQHLDVGRGSGTFRLVLPMWYDGWPHVSFSEEGQESFGGVYFGTGETVYKP